MQCVQREPTLQQRGLDERNSLGQHLQAGRGQHQKDGDVSQLPRKHPAA